MVKRKSIKDQKIFLTDIDNCALNWSKAMYDYLEEHHPNLNIKEHDYSFGLTQKKLDELWREFNKTPLFENIEPLRDAQKYIPKIAKLGFKFVGITSCLSDATSETRRKIQKSRRKNLKRYFGDIFIKCICIQVHESKKPYLELFHPTYWVDDKPKHVASGIDSGHTGFLIIHEYNKNTTFKKRQ